MSETLIDRYRQRREQAVRIGDRAVVAEIDFHLRRYGVTADGPVTVQAEQAAEAEVRPRRGRPPLQRDADGNVVRSGGEAA